VALVPPEGGIIPPKLTSSPPSWTEALWAAGQMFWAHPVTLLWLELRKVLFTLGFTNLGPPRFRLQPHFPILSILFAVSVWRGRVPPHLLLANAAFLISHFAAVVIAYPWTYGYKIILPVQYLFLFCALYLTSRRLGAAGQEDHASLKAIIPANTCRPTSMPPMACQMKHTNGT
jgi:hypothetical protein